MAINETHDPNLTSWVESANDPATDFPIQNLALCVFEGEHEGDRYPELGVRIGAEILDVSMLLEAGYFGHEATDLTDVLDSPFWTALGDTPELWGDFRRRVQAFLRADAPGGQQVRRLRQKAVRPASEVEFTLPTAIFNYSDFYASIHHAATVGSMFRPDNPLLPNYKWMPIGYHGRASSIVPGGTPVRRPAGQQAPPENEGGAAPRFAPCTMLDYELEVGMIVGPGNRLGTPIPIGQAARHMFALCLVNDWSARDIQKWEYQPLGPFLGKNFATSVSASLVMMEALEPFRRPAFTRPAGDPAPLPYLLDERDQQQGGFDITLEARVCSAEMARRGMAPVLLSRSDAFKDLYWTLAQMLAHHTSNGCNVQPGDLLASGTVSGPEPGSRGCLLELSWQGRGPDAKPLPRKPIELPTGEQRLFLEDGDEVILSGFCEREGFRRVGFGECRGKITAAEG